MSPSQRYALQAGITKAKVVHIKGLEMVREVDFEAENYKKEEEPVVETPDEFDWNTQQNITFEKNVEK